MRSWILAILMFCACATPDGAEISVDTADAAREPSAAELTAVTAAMTVADENALPGTTAWRLTKPAPAGVLEAYSGEPSLNHGQSVSIRVSSDTSRTVRWQVYRLGYYQGLGGRLVAEGGPVAVTKRARPAPDPTTGLVTCNWPTTFRVQTSSTWTSGIYLVKLVRDDGYDAWVPLVVRADERKGVAVVQASITTWQAYNSWGGESLYATSSGLPLGHATKVAFDRPYLADSGAGQLRQYEIYFVQWAESHGYDLTYLTDVDLDRDPSLLQRQKLFLSVGHDEYWSLGQRNAVEAALSKGTNLAFLGGNATYWQIRYESSPVTGASRRTMVGYKSLTDPVDGATETVRWRDAPVNRPENALMGAMSETWELANQPFVVTDPTHWIYEGTNVREGDALLRLVGYESDHRYANGAEPAGVRSFASGPVIHADGAPQTHDAVSWQAPSGAFVVSVGSVNWSWGLALPGTADVRAQRMTENVFSRAKVTARSAGATFGATTPSLPDLSVTATVATLAGSPFEEGLVDGPADQALFRRPNQVAVAADGTIYVADTGNHAIRAISPTRLVTTIAGNGSPGRAEGASLRAILKSPTDVAVGADGAVYVADTGNRRIVRLVRSSTGTWSLATFAGSAGGSSGNLDGIGTAARFTSPVAIERVGNDLFVLDSATSRLARVDSTGRVTTLASGAGSTDGSLGTWRLYEPTGLAYGGGALWIVDTHYRKIRRLDTTTLALTTYAGVAFGGFKDGPVASAAFMPYGGIAWTSGGVVVADTGNLRVRRIANGTVRTWAGSGTQGWSDGPGAQATFALPVGLAPLADGTVILADEGASTIRSLR